MRYILHMEGQWELFLSSEKLPLEHPSQKDVYARFYFPHARRYSERADPVPSLLLS